MEHMYYILVVILNPAAPSHPLNAPINQVFVFLPLFV